MSKFKILLFIVVTVLLSSYGIQRSLNEELYLSDLTLNNIDALASGETNIFDCYKKGCTVNFAWNCYSFRDGYLYALCPNHKGY